MYSKKKSFRKIWVSSKISLAAATFYTFHYVRLPCILSAVWLQLEWVKPRLGLLTIHSLRLASGGGSWGGSPTYHHSMCSCNAAVLPAEEWEVWRCVREVFKEWGGGNSKEDRRWVEWRRGWGGRKKTCWDQMSMVNNEQFAKTNSETRFTRVFWQADGVLSFCRRCFNRFIKSCFAWTEH